MSHVSIIFPNQLFEAVSFDRSNEVYLVEEYLFFKQYSFHKVKIAYHRASMKRYQDYLSAQRYKTRYIESHDDRSDVRVLLDQFQISGVTEITVIDPVDDWLSSRLEASCRQANIKLTVLESPMFLNDRQDLSGFFRSDKKKFFQTEFYTKERKNRSVLVDDLDQPVGGKWSFDAENRKKYPKDKTPPEVNYPATNSYWREACQYVMHHYAENPGKITDDPLYPMDFSTSKVWLNDFLRSRFVEFGPYEDAIVRDEIILHHSVLTPMLNTGLLTPGYVLDSVISFSEAHDIPINTTEGFVRQVMGWREFIRGVYQAKGREERTRNFWSFERKIPPSFYNGTTGIDPLDQTITKVLETGYCHHIERLMILGNFMLLCEFDPEEVYRWFMELFIDAYDWVMVPNVYGMSQFADGGLMSTKPYISGSNYLKKMSDYGKGEWQNTWDALFWRFMHVHRDFFLKNPRLSMLIKRFDKMDKKKRLNHLDIAEEFLDNLNY